MENWLVHSIQYCIGFDQRKTLKLNFWQTIQIECLALRVYHKVAVTVVYDVTSAYSVVQP